jgi:oligogalacturonide lyase
MFRVPPSSLLTLLLVLLHARTFAAEAPRDWVEPTTGHRVVRLSKEPGTTKLYFHQNAFTAEGDKMVVPTPDGLAVVNLAKLPASDLESLVEGRVGNTIVGRHTRQVFYQREGKVFATSLDTKATREIATLPPALRRCAGFAINADETLLAGSYVEPKDGPVPPFSGRAAGRLNLEERWEQHLPRRLFTVNITTGEVRTFHPSTEWLNHVQFSPTDPALLMFCHEGPWHKVDRIWTIGADGSGLRKIHARTMDMEIAGHEFFSPDGKTVWYDLQTPKGSEFWLAGCDLASGALTKYRVARENWSVHYNIAPDGKHFAGDGGGPRSVAAPGNGQWIYLFTPKDGVLEAERLVDLSKHDYELEPNVNFTPDGRWIVFQANMQGARHVYAVEVAKAGVTRTKPTIFLIGDSTVKNGTRGLQGWGANLAAHFDTEKVTVENRALGGRSSRSFLREGLWDAVLEQLQPGDFVLMQFGHNDGGPFDEGRARASIKGNGDEMREVTIKETGKQETVRSYGWYLRKYIADAKAKGATPIICSPIPRNIWTNGKVARASEDYGKWAADAAQAAGGAPFLDLNSLIADRYDALGAEAVLARFFTAADHTHTTPEGAEFNAQCVADGLRALPGGPLDAFLRPSSTP